MNFPIDAPDWRMLSQEARDLAFNNSAAVQNSSSVLAEWDTRSIDVRAKHPKCLDLRYGPAERNRIDFLIAGADCPTLVFIHGGYWQTRKKESFAFCAEGPLANGINVALVGYTLAPEATITQIVSEVNSAIDFIGQHSSTLGVDLTRIIVSGWSAGAHLSSTVFNHPLIGGALLISGIYDLEPIQHTYLNAKLNLDQETIQGNSPLLMKIGVDKPTIIVCGNSELPQLRKQSAQFAAYRANMGLPVVYEEIPQANHFTIMGELASPDGRLTQLLATLLNRQTSTRTQV